MLELTNIHKNYKDIQILNGVTLKIEQGNMVGIIGKSGAGKSTLLNIAGTLEKPEDGKVVIDGVNILTLSDKKLAKFRNDRIGFIFQFHYLLPEFTALENVMIPGQIANKPVNLLQEKATQLLTTIGMGHRLHHRPSQLSGGEQQRVAIARSLINDPLVVFADEPTGNLDDATSDEIHRLFKMIQKDLKTTLVIATHSDVLAKQCDVVYRIDNGQIETE